MPKQDLAWFLDNPPLGLAVDDDEFCQSLLETNQENVYDLIDYLYNEHKIANTEYGNIGSSKFTYDEGDSYDWHAAIGCLNCGSEYNLLDYGAMSLYPDKLICTRCGYSPCPRYTTTSLTTIDSDPLENSIYLMGTRKSFRFSTQRKEWWEEYFLPKSDREQRMAYQLRAVETMSKNKGHIITEECLACGHDQAYYHTFQARSADEGMTIMYECCQCGSRKVFNN